MFAHLNLPAAALRERQGHAVAFRVVGQRGGVGLAACVRTWKTGRHHNSKGGRPFSAHGHRSGGHYTFVSFAPPSVSQPAASAKANDPWCRTTHSATAASAFSFFLSLSVHHAPLRAQSCDNVPAHLASRVARKYTHHLVVVVSPANVKVLVLPHKLPRLLQRS